MIPSGNIKDKKCCLSCHDYKLYVTTTDDSVTNSLEIPSSLQMEIRKALFMKSFNPMRRIYGFPRCTLCSKKYGL